MLIKSIFIKNGAYLYLQIVKSGFSRVTRQVNSKNFTEFFGDIVVPNTEGNDTERVIFYTFPKEALAKAQNSNSNFSGQYSVVFFAQNLFETDQSVREVSC